MIIFRDEQDIVTKLNEHDELILQCSRGELSWSDFLSRYNDFPWYYALDGHESDEEEKILLQRYKKRIDTHLAFADQFLSYLCKDEDSKKEEYIKAGRFGTDVASDKIKTFVLKYYSINNKQAT